MTEEERNRKKAEYAEMPASELVLKLIVLLWKILISCIIKLFIWIIKLIAKGFRSCFDLCMKGWNELVRFWNLSDTQEKKKRIIDATKRTCRVLAEYGKKAWTLTRTYTVVGAKYAWKYTCIGSRLFVKYVLIAVIAFWHGLLWTLHTTKDLIIHSKPTFIRLGKNIKQGVINLWHWCVNVRRGMKLRRIRRKRAWQHFRRTKGFRGLLIDMSQALSNGIKNYMSEDVTEADPESITEDEIIAEKMQDRKGKVDKIGKRFFEGMKDIVEEK